MGPVEVNTLTLSIPLADCASRHRATMQVRTYEKVRKLAGLLPATAHHVTQRYGIVLREVEAEISPLATLAAGHLPETLVELARLLHQAATDAGIETLCGFSTGGAASWTAADRALAAAMPVALAASPRLRGTLYCSSTAGGLDYDAIKRAARVLAEIDGKALEQVTVACNASPLAPHDGTPRVHVALSADAALARLVQLLPVSESRGKLAAATLQLAERLAHAGRLLATEYAAALSRYTPYPVEPGETSVVLGASGEAFRYLTAIVRAAGGDTVTGPGALALFYTLDSAIRQGVARVDRQGAARSGALMPSQAFSPETTLLQSVAFQAVTNGGPGRFVLPPPWSVQALSAFLADLFAVSAATGRSARAQLVQRL